MELEEDHASLSLKAITKNPAQQEGKKYSYNPDNATQGGAIQAAGYKVGPPERGNLDILSSPPWIPNPIVQKALYEIRRVVNAIIRKYGKPSAIRIEMARDLEVNTTRYKQFLARQSENTKANAPHRGVYKNPSTIPQHSGSGSKTF